MTLANSPGKSARIADERIDREWWKEAVVYQIYPKSFNDTDGDGVGDIPGIRQRVDYLDELDVDAVWLSPVYQSPQADNGYDISDYRAIDDQYGEMADFEALLSELHDRDMRLIMDLVVNHTSDEHEWFQRSRRGEEPYDDYYYWREGDPDEPPNNWDSFFGGPAWSYDDEREEWYLHLFDEKQPDLNWRNPAVREAVYAMIRWWLGKGVDGFRLDALSHLAKPEGLPDGDPDAQPTGVDQYSHAPQLETYLAELNEQALADYDVLAVAEMGHTTIEEAAEYVEREANGLDMTFQFDHMGVGGDPDTADDEEGWNLPEFKTAVADKQAAIEWPAPFLGNHDNARTVSRLGDEEQYRRRSATLLATHLLTLRGTPYVYQGEELGMTNVEFESLEEVDDVMTVGHAEALDGEGAFEAVRDLVNEQSRDHARTPMQWSADANAGFTDGEPWLKVNDDYTEINVAAQRRDSDSVRTYYQQLIALRHDADVLVYGDFEMHYPDHESVFAYTRTLGEDRALVVLNWSDEPTSVEVPDGVPIDGLELAIGNYEAPARPDAQLELQPWDARVYLTESR